MDSGNSESLGAAFGGLSLESGAAAHDREIEPQPGAVAVAVAVMLGVISVSLRLILLAPFMGLRAALRFPWAEAPAATDAAGSAISSQG